MRRIPWSKEVSQSFRTALELGSCLSIKSHFFDVYALVELIQQFDIFRLAEIE